MQALSVRHDDIACVGISDHEAAFRVNQVQRNQQADAGIKTILVSLARKRLRLDLTDPRNYAGGRC